MTAKYPSVDRSIWAFAERAVDDAEPRTDNERAAWTNRIAVDMQLAFENIMQELADERARS